LDTTARKFEEECCDVDYANAMLRLHFFRCFEVEWFETSKLFQTVQKQFKLPSSQE